MCTSAVQIVFNVVLVVGIVLTLASLFTPGWNNVVAKAKNGTQSQATDSLGGDFGLITKACKDVAESSTVGTPKTSTGCEAMWKSWPDWKKAVVACFGVALVAELAALAWSIVVCFMCCCKSCLTPPLPIFSGIAVIALAIALIVFGVNNKDAVAELKPPTGMKIEYETTPGYSLYLGIGAVLAMIVATIVGIVVNKVAKVAPL